MGRNSASVREKNLQSVIDYVAENGASSVEDLASVLDVSVMTIYRYVSTLEESGLVRRDHGTISLAPFTLAEASALMRNGTQVGAKEKLAQAALKFLRPSTSVALDDSTTCMHLFPSIAELAPITIMTNSRMLAQEVLRYPRAELIQIGGNYVRWADAFTGSIAVQQIKSLSPDFCIMSTTAMSSGMLSHPDSAMADVKRAMLESAQTTVLVLDRTKFERAALYKFYDVKDIDVVITEKTVNPDMLNYLKECVGELITV
ncbi:DeoR/GlpR transcriptional regulator [Arcanobacterium haemolyticum]|nr:DeoR/GlpR transcriptional regulator [Arcanobacterium haemolyticum]